MGKRKQEKRNKRGMVSKKEKKVTEKRNIVHNLT